MHEGRERGGPRDGRRLGVAVLGCGGVARQYHLRALRRDRRVRLVALADSDPEALAAAACAGPRLLADPLAAIGDPEVEAVVVCTPPATHEELGRAALERGLHLYLEKPIALSISAAVELQQRAATGEMVCAVGLNYRFNRAFGELRRRLDERGDEPPEEVSTSLCEPVGTRLEGWRAERRAGGGALLDLATHEVDTLRWLLDDPVVSVQAASLAPGRETDRGDWARYELRTERGTQVRGRVSYAEGREHRWSVRGHHAPLRLDRWPARVSSRPRPPLAQFEQRLRDSPLPRHERSFRLALAAFVGAALGGGRDPRLAGLDDGLESLRVVLAIEAAAREGALVELLPPAELSGKAR